MSGLSNDLAAHTCSSGTDSDPPPAGPPVLSRKAAVLLAVGASVVGLVTAVQLAVLFLGAAPPNTVSKRFDSGLQRWSQPWFQQNWRLFAPDPLMVNVRVQARARTTSGTVSPWIDLSKEDYGSGMLHHPWPSREGQYELGYAWFAYAQNLTTVRNANGGAAETELLQKYLVNLVVGRLSWRVPGPYSAVEIQVTTQPDTPPGGRKPAATSRTFPWWAVPAGTEVSR
ncbi:DUF5819 family protein [Streptomyces sp. NPDC021224]|uniref:DUF5819 family protein n=1 Tax=unclassified Streptomyces TaxID=2593676 RepID=UPI0037A575C5